ncbi:MAG: hypothetical protein WCP99_22535 [Burkholderiales bacterium]
MEHHWDGIDRRIDKTGHDREQSDLLVLSERFQALHDDVSEIKSAIRDLAAAITKLALIEDRQSNVAAAQERLFASLARLELRVIELEKSTPANNQTHAWVEKAILLAAGAALLFAWSHIIKGF